MHFITADFLLDIIIIIIIINRQQMMGPFVTVSTFLSEINNVNKYYSIMIKNAINMIKFLIFTKQEIIL